MAAKSEATAARVLNQAFYDRHTLLVARDLLGKVVKVRTSDGISSGRIVETEAYRADDPASHSCRGETPRASVMFGKPGVAYVYLIYGMYEMLNFVTEPTGQAGAVLIRALEPLHGMEHMLRRRSGGRNASGRSFRNSKINSAFELAAGPGKLCRSLGVKLSHNGESLRGPAIQVLDDGYRPDGILVSPRVGISVGTEKPWRFFVEGHSCVSRAPQNRMARLLSEVRL